MYSKQRTLQDSEMFTVLCSYFFLHKTFHYEGNLCNVQDVLMGIGTFSPVGKLIKSKQLKSFRKPLNLRT